MNNRTWLALGDSYTIGEAVPENERYPEQAAVLLRQMGISMRAPQIIARTGWTSGDLISHSNHLENPAGEGFDIVSLLTGVNNQYQGKSISRYDQEFSLLVDRCIKAADLRPAHVIVLSIPDYSKTAFGRSRPDPAAIAEEIDAFNVVNRSVAMTKSVHYLDITEESRKAGLDPELVAADGLHYSGKAYAVWADLLAKLIARILG